MRDDIPPLHLSVAALLVLEWNNLDEGTQDVGVWRKVGLCCILGKAPGTAHDKVILNLIQEYGRLVSALNVSLE